MQKDLFDFVVVPTKNEYRKNNIIDEIYGLPNLDIKESSFLIHNHEYLINDAIRNYNNEIVMAKIFYTNMNKYQKYYLNRKNEEYDFFSRKYAEQTIIELFSIYDKSLHIINYMFNLKIKPCLKFYDIIKSKLDNTNEFYEKFTTINEKLYKNKENVIRNDIIHNISNFFERYVPIYEKNNKSTGWYIEEKISYEEYKKIIDYICSILVENKKLILEKLKEMYPKKGTDAYNKKVQEDQNELKKLFSEH